MDFLEKLATQVERNNSLLCVGLDSDTQKLPSHLSSRARLFAFNKAIIDVTADLVCAYKMNSAFYEAEGASGIEQLRLTCDYIKKEHPGMPTILDYKRGDIGNTNDGYVRLAFDYLGVDAVTVNPYLGGEALKPFLDHADKGIIILCRTSNPGGGEFQDLEANGKKIYKIIAEKVKNDWNSNNNCLLVVGATYPEELANLRTLMGQNFVFLVPGIGAQGGDIRATVAAGVNEAGQGIIINSSRDIIFASNGRDFNVAARDRALKTRDEINNSKGELNVRHQRNNRGHTTVH